MTLATSLRAVLRLVGRDRRWVSLAVALPLTLAALGIGLIQPLLARHVIDSVTAGQPVWPGVVLVVVVFAGQALVAAGAGYLLARTGEAVVFGTRVRLVERLVRLPLPTYHRYRVGDLISRVGTDTVALRRVVAEGITGVVTGTVGVIAVVLLMLWLDWVLALVVAALIGTGLAVIVPILRRIRTASAQGQQAVGDLAAGLERALGAIRTVRASRAEHRETRRITDRANAAYQAGVRMAKLEAMIGPASELAVTGSLLVALLVGGVRVASGASSVGDLVAFALYLVSLTAPVSALFEAVSAIQQGTGALRRIDQALALPPEPDHATVVEHDAPTRDAYHPPVLELSDLWFGYRPQRPVLRGVRLTVPRGGHVALVGRSGAGKSTIFALVERFYDPDRGVIRCHGRDVRTLTRSEHRAAIGLVEQDCPVLYGTVRDNLVYAHPEAGDDDIERALELARLSELVAGLPKGLDTPVGERGVLVSGGERQRLAIARALLPRPSLLLLDEPTAHLDPANERALMAAVGQISAECAVLVAGHRPSTVRATRHIVVLDQGTVVGVGSHDELLETSHHYRHLTGGAAHHGQIQPAS